LGIPSRKTARVNPGELPALALQDSAAEKPSLNYSQFTLWSVSLKADTVVSQPGVTKAKIAKVHTASTTLHPFNGVFSRTTWVRRYQKGKTSLDLNEARDVGVWDGSGISWTIRKKICTSLQTDNHTNTPSVGFYGPDALPDAQPTVSKH